MVASAFFGPPKGNFQRDGAHIAVYLVPVFDGRLVAFDVNARGAQDRWLPWNVLPYGENPYVEASALADDWCGGAMRDLRLADVLSGSAEESWELSLLYRLELTAMPRGDALRKPVALALPLESSIRQFETADLERWVRSAQPGNPPPRPAAPQDSPKLLF
jgi:hypothetical protein